MSNSSDDMAIPSADLDDLIAHTFIDFTQTREFLKRPLVISRADRISYWDTQGREFLDGLSGVYAVSLGHRHPRLRQAIIKQFDKVALAPPMHGVAETALDLVAKLGEITPSGLDFVKTFSGGSEANEAALKFVRQYHRLTGNHGKYKTLSFYGGYHGATAGAMAVSGTGTRKTQFEPQMAGFLKVQPPVFFQRFAGCSPEESSQLALHAIKGTIEGEDPETVGALMVEPIIHLQGIAVPPTGFLSGLRKLCDEFNILLIFDEIITGMGRTGQMFAAQTFNVTPDIICCGKGLSAGVLPLSAMVTKSELAAEFLGEEAENRHFNHGHTFASHALAAAVGIEVINTFADEDILRNVQLQGSYLQSRLQELQRELPISDIRGEGLLWGFDFVREPGSSEVAEELGALVKAAAIEQGLIMRVTPTWGSLAPALVSTEQELDRILDRLQATLGAAWDRMPS